MKTSLISCMRDTSVFMKTIALTVTVTFSMLVLTPTAIAARSELEKKNQASTQSNPEAALSEVYQKITEKLDKIERARAKGKDPQKLIYEIEKLRSRIDDLDAEVMANFEALEAELKKKNLPAKIMQRHHDMVQHYVASRNDFARELDNLDKNALEQFIDRWLHEAKVWMGEAPEPVESPFKDQNINTRKFKRSQQPFDPNNLPFKSMRPAKDNKPKKHKNEFHQAGLFNSPSIQLADLGDFTYDQLPGASDPAYLAETDEVLLSQPIKDQAEALDYDPVKIYHWVRNNVEWQPTWGAVQDAELTLDARRGNAMDIASLTIALLRASQIPARYAHGTIEVPIDKFKNWAGGFTSSDAAVDYAASGGIPTAAAIKGGKIDSVELEHIWVEAAIDYIPSRGAKNRDADSWVPMDPSYKQYEYLEGLDAVEISGIDTEQLANNFINSGTINGEEGWISGFDPTILENAQQQAQTALEDYISNNIPDPTVGDVIGGRQIIHFQAPVLASGLPYHVLLEGVTYDHLPRQLQQTVTYTLGRDELNQPVNPTTFAWSTLNNEKVVLSFKPATADDAQVLRDYLTEEGLADPSLLPSSIPSYLIQVIPELRINDVTVVSGEPIALGEELIFSTNIRFPGRSKHENYDYNVIAGSYLSVNVISSNVSSIKLQELQTKISNTADTVVEADPIKLEPLNRDNTLGDMFYAGTLSYFAELISFSRMMAESGKSNYIMTAGYGTFGYVPRVDTLFGFPVAIKPGVLSLDIPINIISANTDGNKDKQKIFVVNIGAMSSLLEHAIPEQLYDDGESYKLDFMSAMKGIQKAQQEGQNIYQITSDNIVTTLPHINASSTTLDEITASVKSGLSVTVHENPVSVPGYTGTGYVITDNETGNGAYKISGGSNGGEGEMINASVDLGTNLTALFAATMDTALNGFGSHVSDLKTLQKVLPQLAAVISAVTLAIDLWNNCPNPLVMVALVALFVALTIALTVFLGTLALGPLTLLLASIVGSVAIKETVDKLKNISGC